MMRTIAGIFVDRHANVEPGRPVAGTYYVLRTMRAVHPDRLLARLAEEQNAAVRRTAPDRHRRPAGPAGRGTP